MQDNICSKCGKPNDRFPQRYCRTCHAAYMRDWRPSYGDLPESEKEKARCRSFTNMLIRRGAIERPVNCISCPSTDRIENHHEDYSDPYTFEGMCIDCHKELHRCSA